MNLQVTRARKSDVVPGDRPGHRDVMVRSGILHITDEGPRDGSVVVLLHGFTGSHESFAALRKELRRERRVISPDLPGHGATQVDLKAFSMPAAAMTILEALETIGVERFALLGYSMGGRLALFLALTEPRQITRLILESAGAGIANPIERTRRKAADEDLAGFIEREGIEAFVNRWEKLPLFASLNELPAGRSKALRQQRLRGNPSGLAASLREMGAGEQPWLGERARELEAATLIVTGERDTQYNAIAASLARAIPNAHRAIIAGAGHVPHLERPETFNDAVLNFLSDFPKPSESKISATRRNL